MDHFHQNLRGMEGEKVELKDGVRSWKAIENSKAKKFRLSSTSKKKPWMGFEPGENIASFALRVYYHNTRESNNQMLKQGSGPGISPFFSLCKK